MACHWAEDIKAGKPEPHEVEPVFEAAQAPAYEPPPAQQVGPQTGDAAQSIVSRAPIPGPRTLQSAKRF